MSSKNESEQGNLSQFLSAEDNSSNDSSDVVSDEGSDYEPEKEKLSKKKPRRQTGPRAIRKTHLAKQKIIKLKKTMKQKPKKYKLCSSLRSKIRLSNAATYQLSELRGPEMLFQAAYTKTIQDYNNRKNQSSNNESNKTKSCTWNTISQEVRDYFQNTFQKLKVKSIKERGNILKNLIPPSIQKKQRILASYEDQDCLLPGYNNNSKDNLNSTLGVINDERQNWDQDSVSTIVLNHEDSKLDINLLDINPNQNPCSDDRESVSTVVLGHEDSKLGIELLEVTQNERQYSDRESVNTLVLDQGNPDPANEANQLRSGVGGHAEGPLNSFIDFMPAAPMPPPPLPPYALSPKQLYSMVMQNRERQPWETLSKIDKRQYQSALRILKKDYIRKYKSYLNSLTSEQLHRHRLQVAQF